MRTVLVLLVCLAISGCASFTPPAPTYYTTANIWYEKHEIIPIYHKGTMIPAGTRVRVSRCRGGSIPFFTDDGARYVLINAAKYSTIGLRELFEQYFSERDVMAEGGLFSTFTAEEQELIRKGEIAPGMCKEAVLMAYGYPPSHETRSTTSNTWVYWKSKFKDFPVYFKDNRMTFEKEPQPEAVPEEKPGPEGKPSEGNKGYLTGGAAQGAGD